MDQIRDLTNRLNAVNVFSEEECFEFQNRSAQWISRVDTLANSLTPDDMHRKVWRTTTRPGSYDMPKIKSHGHYDPEYLV